MDAKDNSKIRFYHIVFLGMGGYEFLIKPRVNNGESYIFELVSSLLLLYLYYKDGKGHKTLFQILMMILICVYIIMVIFSIFHKYM